MSRRRTSSLKESKKGSAWPSLGKFGGGSDALHQRKHHELIRQRIGTFLERLFAEFTGVHFLVAWTPHLSTQWEAGTLPTGCSVCCRLAGAGPRPPAECRTCGQEQLKRALRTKGKGHRFTCRLGVRNYWIPIRVRTAMLGIAFLQTLEGMTAAPPARNRPMRVRHGRLGRATARTLNSLEFARAARLLHFIVEHVQMSILIEIDEADLANAVRAIRALEREQARLHRALQRHQHYTPQTTRRTSPLSRPEQIVHCLLERIEKDYRKSLTLQQCANQLGMNPAYLSTLFSRCVGLPFKAALTERRLEKSKELLSEPTNYIADVASAVGYASDDRFRIAFKQSTGLSPRQWRAAMRVSRP